ncbi:SpoIIE family protein phosphatase [Nocardioides limicola]|uniref:SpoIIE family protein phosphatase n=1 Tax=Nocardioides limicola TaxID=2803368 RepID=UPI00193B5178|nr:SpoIIE family protein phosphatase [Nocardioides sp. DJM-14]
MRETATDLQVPGVLPVLPGVSLAGRYLLTETEPSDRGDTLDAFDLPGGRVGLMVVDVVGHGFPAALVANGVRSVLRERLGSGISLGTAVESLHRLARQVPEAATTTLCAVVMDRRDGAVEYIAAGHPAPLVWGATGPPRSLGESRGRPLGTGAQVQTGRTRLEVGESLLLVTDGILGGVGEAGELERAIVHARARLAMDTDSPALRDEEVCAELLAAVPAPGLLDDAALLLMRRIRPAKPLALTLPATPRQFVVARERVGAWLDSLGAGLADRVSLGHAVHELIANVIEHAYGASADGVFQLTGVLTDDGTAVIMVTDHGRWSSGSAGGRGLVMAAGLTDDLRIQRTDRGTAVEVRRRLGRPVPFLASVPIPEVDALFESGRGPGLRTESTEGRLTAAGPIDDVTVEAFETALWETTRVGTADAVIDLTGVTLLASPGVQAIFDMVRRSHRSGSVLQLVAEAGSPAALMLDRVDLPYTE